MTKHTYRIIGDIHGKIDTMRTLVNCDAEHIVFCGDFVDSYNNDYESQKECIHLALNMIEEGIATAVWANHEWSYFHPSMKCSGWSATMAKFMIELRDEILNKFKPFARIDKYLVTHAGLSKQLWEKYNLTLDTFEDKLREWSEDITSPYFAIGRSHGGRADCGGLLWCDYNLEFIPIPGLPQVFGHTRGRELRNKGNSYCIDVLDYSQTVFDIHEE